MKTNYKLRYVDWTEIRDLSKNILNYIQSNGIKIDTLVPIFRGGSILSLILSSNLENVDTACLHIKRSLSNEANSEFGNSILKGFTNIDAIKGKNVLITEDIIDSGLTIDKAVDIIKEYNPKNIYIATIYNFNKNKYKDVISGEVMKEVCWVVFPWEEKLNETN